VPENLGLGGSLDHLEHGEAISDRLFRCGGEDHADCPRRLSPRPSARIEHSPEAFHAEVGVHRQVRPDPEKQVLAPRDDLLDRTSGEVDGRKARDPEVAAGEHLAGQRLVQVRSDDPDRVSLGHCVIVALAAAPA